MSVLKRYRSKPVEIEAVQYEAGFAWKLEQLSQNIISSPILEPREGNERGEYIQIKTLEGTMTAIPGDWIIKGTEGEFYPCKPSVFERKYKEVK